jgi:hypothetical protein
MKNFIRKVALSVVLSHSCLPAQSQASNDEIRVPCSAVIAAVSYYWQIDSLPSNGYRRAVKDRFLDCDVDSVQGAFILEKLGPPTWKTEDSFYIDYCYNYYDWKFIDHRKYKSGYGFDTLHFTILKKNGFLQSITKFTTEY